MIAWLDTLADDPREAEFMIWLYHEFKSLMFATAKKYVSNPQDCEDIVQDSLERLVKKFRSCGKKSVAFWPVTLSLLLGTHRSTT